eukprot:Phypoly_transcript_00611.p1 GENE.Phypoly_transcript_00611~~Phypoly_transcript_00611.p1  ORF type:complete len:1420 (+),score=266.83 Phypoly_transcript_00611:78-4337(+)
MAQNTSVYAWGSGQGGRVGVGDQGNHTSPVLLSYLNDISISLISAGAAHSVAVSATGELYTWGDGTFGKLGHGNEAAQTFPKLVTALKGITITSISAGGKHTAAASEKGELYMWGSDDAGQIGLGYQKTNQTTPKALPSMRGIIVVQLSCGAQRSAALTDKGEVYTWGRGDHGRLGHGDAASLPYPKLVAALRGIPIISISSGGGHNAALTASGEVYCWGRGDSGQLGIGSKAHQSTPKIVQALQGVRIIDISAGGYHTIAVSDSGSMYSWDYGVLGTGEEQNQLLPKIVNIAGDEKIIHAFAGFWHNLAINDNYELFTWGNGDGGKLGHGTEESQNFPLRVASMRDIKIVRLSAGETHSMALAQETEQKSRATTPFQPILPLQFRQFISGNPNPSSPSISNQPNTRAAFKAPPPRVVPPPDEITHAFQSHTDWFECVQKLRALVSVLENFNKISITPSNSTAPRRSSVRTNSYFSHFTEVDIALKNFDTTNTGIKVEVESLLSQKSAPMDRLDHLVAQRKLIADALIPDMRTTLSSWETQIVGKFNTAIGTISEELVKCGISREALEEKIGNPVSAQGCAAQLANVIDQIRSYISGMTEVLSSIPTGAMDELQFHRLQRVAVVMASNILECGKQHLALAREQKRIAQSITSSYQARLAELENLQPSIDAGNERLKERDRLRTALRTCKHAIIDSTGKLEMLVLDEADDSLIQIMKSQLKELRTEEQNILNKQQEIEDSLQEISHEIPEINVQMQKSASISNKIRDTGLVVDDRKLDHYDKIKTLATTPHNVFLMLYAGQEVVLKEFSVTDEASKKMLETQVSLITRIGSHPVILPIDAIFFDKNAYVQMKYIEGGNLRQWLFGKDSTDANVVTRKPWEIQRVLHQISQGIAYMHSCRVIHRDLKLENILMKGNQQPVITDFELSKDSSMDSLATSLETINAQSEEYLAPEMRERKSTGTTGSDMWSFGIIIYKAHFPSGPLPVLLPGNKAVTIPPHENERLRVLLSSLLQRDPLLRPSAHQVCVHPYFTISLVEDMVSSKQLVDSDKKIAAFRAHLSSLSELLDTEDCVVPIIIHRQNLVEDVLKGLKDITKDNLCWRLEVQFVGEKGVDYGGLSAEMFSLFFNHGSILDSAARISVFSPESGMFERSAPESYFYLPVTNAYVNKKAQAAFQTIGKIFLKMVVDGRPLPDAFAPSFFKFLLGIPPNLQDLEAYDAPLALSFRKLLVLERVEDFLSETFEGLEPGGENKVLTDSNKEEYIQKKIEKYLVTDRLEQLESIRKGFLSIESLRAHFNLFSPTELTLLLCGNSHIHAESIKRNLKFKFFPVTSQTPEYLCAVLDELSQDNLRRFLRYITGMVAIPIEGMGKSIIVQCQQKSDHLPSAHTCSFQLDMPDYNQPDVTKKKILKMLEWLDSGFAFV